MDRNERICVLGAGAAGISAATYLREAGFTRVTVLEKEERVGGKCRTHREGELNWELGAILATTDYATTLELMRRAGMEPWRKPRASRPPETAFEGGGVWDMARVFPGWVARSELPAALAQIARYQLLAPRWKAAFAPGHAGVPAELAAPVSTWIARHRMETLGKLWSIPYVSFGYGFYDEVPAAYALKYFDPGVTRALALKRKFFNWKEGVQTLWERLAAPLEVRTGMELGRVRRGASVEVSGAERRSGAPFRLEFDRLVVACPWDEVLAVSDASDDELALASRIRHTDYRVRLVRTEGMRVPSGFAPGRFSRAGLGLPMIWDERNRGTGTVAFYVLGDGSTPGSTIDANVEAEVLRLGGRVVETMARADWKYFPHVGPEDYAGGWYGRFEGLQGRNRTFVTGEIASFSTVERSARYSRDLVRRFFA